jgi:hypothetical protein
VSEPPDSDPVARPRLYRRLTAVLAGRERVIVCGPAEADPAILVIVADREAELEDRAATGGEGAKR